MLLFDKPKGKTSYRAIEEVQRLLGIKKIGHSGTLDKSASGLLIICTGLATKLTRFFLDSDKRYIGIIKLGIITDTGDQEGVVTETRDTGNLADLPVNSIRDRFLGEIEQMPPEYSALKIRGRRASDIMRNGEQVSLKTRKVSIRELNIMDFDPVHATLTIDVHCSKGTYIRALARDIGEFLGTGAYLLDLRRTEAGGFRVDDALSLEEIERVVSGAEIDKKYIYKPVDALSHLGRITIKDESLKRVKNGADFSREDVVSIEGGPDGPFVITDGRKNLIAIANVDVDNWSITYLNVFNW